MEGLEEGAVVIVAGGRLKYASGKILYVSLLSPGARCRARAWHKPVLGRRRDEASRELILPSTATNSAKSRTSGER